MLQQPPTSWLTVLWDLSPESGLARPLPLSRQSPESQAFRHNVVSRAAWLGCFPVPDGLKLGPFGLDSLPLCFSPCGRAFRGEGRCWAGSGHHDLTCPSTVQATDRSKDRIRTSMRKKPQEAGDENLQVMKLEMVVRATQGHTTFTGTGRWRMRGAQCQRLAEDWSKRQKFLCWQDLSCAGPSGKTPRHRSHGCQENGTLPPPLTVGLILYRHTLLLLSSPRQPRGAPPGPTTSSPFTTDVGVEMGREQAPSSQRNAGGGVGFQKEVASHTEPSCDWRHTLPISASEDFI